jgi:hypothetical protein
MTVYPMGDRYTGKGAAVKQSRYYYPGIFPEGLSKITGTLSGFVIPESYCFPRQLRTYCAVNAIFMDSEHP